MHMSTEMWRPTPLFDSSDHAKNHLFYRQSLEYALQQVLPSAFYEIQDPREGLMQFSKLVPRFVLSEFKLVPFNLSVFLLCTYRPNAFQFFFEMITKWLVPGKRLNVELFYAVDFHLRALSDEVYTIAEVILRIDTQKDLEVLHQHLPIVETELKLGVTSVYHARRILELKGMGIDNKTAMIQESIAKVIKKRSTNIDWDILAQMQHFLVTCSDKFKAVRDVAYMSKLICLAYLFRKELKQADKKKVLVKLMQTRLANRQHRVLGVLVAMNIEESESFAEQHLMRALQQEIADLKIVEGSFFSYTQDPLLILYLEAEKKDSQEVAAAEILLLKRELSSKLRSYVKRFLHPIFMPRNEEEVMRNVVTLSNQIKLLRDLPEVILSFEEQTATKLSFLVILVCLVKEDSVAIGDAFRASFLEYIPERTKVVGMLRKRYVKEAHVFHVRLDRAPFMRGDQVVDLYKARGVVVKELARVLGELRDYNGGMIAKQNEQFLGVQQLLGSVAKQHEILLENFFYSIKPVVMRSLLEPDLVKKLFLFLLEVLQEDIEGRFLLRSKEESESFFVIALFHEEEAEILRAVGHLQGSTHCHISLSIQGKAVLGFIVRDQDSEKHARFYGAVEEVLKSW